MISHKKVEIPSYYFARYWTLCNAQTQPQTFNYLLVISIFGHQFSHAFNFRCNFYF